MSKLLLIGDVHYRGTSPRNRKDDYQAAAKNKLLEIFAIAKNKKVDAILQTGDLFDRPEVSITTLLNLKTILEQSPVPIYLTPGNHDIYSYNLSTYNRTSLKLLELLVPQLKVITDPAKPQLIGNTLISFQPYSSEVDVYGFGYAIEEDIVKSYPDHYKIKVTHGYCMLNAPVWDRYTLIADCQTNADLVINGHDHKGHGVFKRHDGVIFSNPGALMRKEATTHNAIRSVDVIFFEVGSDKQLLHEIISLTSAKPGDEVLDRSHIEAENQRREAMDSFKMLIQAKTGDKTLIDIDQVIQEIAAAEGIDSEVVQIALDKIHAERGSL